MPGISGFLPLFKIGMVDKGQTIFISSAAGAVGYNYYSIIYFIYNFILYNYFSKISDFNYLISVI
jgi:hypothetical protein